jgi:hypothetical protein
VILVDANLLVYAANRAAHEHARAVGWLDAQLNGTARVGLPWPSLTAFVRLVSNPVIMRRPVSTAEAWHQIEQWLACDAVWIPQPGPEHQRLLGDMISQPWMTNRLVPDAHLAALAIEHGLTMCSSDGDFARFPGLKWLNPLAA